MGRIRYGARTDDELRNREVEATATGAWATVLDAFYETDPDVIAAVLPPPLEPADEPRVRITIARVDMRGLPTFGAGAFAVRCKHEGTVGDYALVMPMTTEQSVIGGRETFGEPKKLAEVTLEREPGGDRVVGRFTRLGTTFVTVSGSVREELPNPPERKRTDFYFKFLPAPDGKGFDAEPSLVYCHRAEQTRKLERVDGEITLADSRFDPVADLPVRRVVQLTLCERHSVQRGEINSRVPGEFLRPYVHQRYDDLSPVGEG
ncbi:MAG TPA: acetoacetate decarboxylase family protein [Acidimicrobiia bacterium]|jgi:acetoacetate decarboxylase|nr:acetoacetate decarboxylase family protein [Acidimicrobiia bacterium]